MCQCHDTYTMTTKSTPKIYRTIRIEENVAITLQEWKKTLNFDNLTEVIEKFMPSTRELVFNEFEKHSSAIRRIIYEYHYFLDTDLVIMDLLQEVHSYIGKLILDEIDGKAIEIMESLMDTLKEGEK